MQKLSLAFIALISILLNVHPLNAQERNAKSANAGETIVVEKGETQPGLTISHKNLIVRGCIGGDVHATNSRIVIERGGKVTGTIFAKGGEVRDASDQPARIVPESAPAETPLVTSGIVLTSPPAALETNAEKPRKNWFESQVALLLLGLIGGALVRIAAPRAASRVAETVGMEPGRCLLVGGVSAVSLGVISLVNTGLTHSFLGGLWIPFGFVVASGVLVTLAFGWLCGMRWAGGWFAGKSGRRNEGDFYIRLMVGLGAFFLLNTILGGISSFLGTISLLTQFAVAIMGLGAAIITGFGKTENWLGARMNGSSRGKR